MLNAIRVEEIMKDSLFTDEEVPDVKKVPADAVLVESIMNKWGFNKERLESHRAEVKAMLDELPDNYQKGTGDGWSFLNMCMDRNGRQWGEHMHMDQLCALAIGLKLGKFLLPRKMWSILPGGMPYFGCTTERTKSENLPSAV